MKTRNNFRTVKVGNKTVMCERRYVRAFKLSVYRAFVEKGAMLWFKWLNGNEEE